jgi:acetyl-CoA carboxylase alpha subunit
MLMLPIRKQINKLIETKKHILKNLTAWQRVQLSRHPSRPYNLDHVVLWRYFLRTTWRQRF